MNTIQNIAKNAGLKESKEIVYSESADEVTLYYVKWRMILYAIGCCLFIALDIFQLAKNAISPLYGYLGLAAFGYFAVWCLRMLIQNEPALVMNKETLSIHTAMGQYSIPWSEIEEIKIALQKNSRSNHQFLFVYPRDTKKYIESQPSTSRPALHLNVTSNGAPLSIATTSLPLHSSQLSSLIESILEDKSISSV